MGSQGMDRISPNPISASTSRPALLPLACLSHISHQSYPCDSYNPDRFKEFPLSVTCHNS